MSSSLKPHLLQLPFLKMNYMINVLHVALLNLRGLFHCSFAILSQSTTEIHPDKLMEALSSKGERLSVTSAVQIGHIPASYSDGVYVL